MAKALNQPSTALRNLGLKIVAVVLALLLWFHAVTNRDYEITLDFRLDYVEMPESLAIAQPPPSTIGARVRGNGKRLFALWWRGDRTWPISMSEATVGEYPITLGHEGMPRFGIEDIEVVDILQRGEWALLIDSVGSKTVGVYTTERFAAAEQFIPVGPLTLTPDTVRLHGPRSQLAQIDSVALTVIGSAVWVRNIDERIAVAPLPVYNVTVEPDSVEATRRIEPFVMRQFDSLPVAVVGVRDTALSVTPAWVAVSIGGPDSYMSQLRADSVRVFYAAGRGDTSGTRGALWVNVSAPFEVLEVTPDSVTVQRHGATGTSPRN
ncbi:MAG TPA: hypothetical protein VGB22_00220 [candidate division Zixibacteria bacterium]|jgi:hypothetical protein